MTATVAPIDVYIEAAMRHAVYEWLHEDGLYFGHIAGIDGLWATGPAIDECATELRAVLAGWIEVGLKLGQAIPEIDGQTVPSLPATERWTAADLAAIEEQNRHLYDEPAVAVEELHTRGETAS